MTYLDAAAAFPDVNTDHWSLRIGLLLPVKLVHLLFGRSEVTYYAVPLLAGAAVVASTYVIGRHLFGRVVGLASVAVLLSSNWYLSYSSALLPDHVAAALVTAAIAVAVAPSSDRRSKVTLVAIGLLFGWAYLVREFILLLIVPLGLIVWRRWSRRGLALAALPVAGLLIGELVANALVHGNPFARWQVAGSHDEVVGRIEAPLTRLDALGSFPSALVQGAGTGPLVALGILAVVGAAWSVPHRRVIAPWVVVYVVPLVALSGVLDPDLRLFRSQLLRYWTPILPAVVIGGLGAVSVALARAWNRPPDSFSARLVIGGTVLALTALVVSVGQDGEDASHIYIRNGATQLREIRALLDEHGEDASTVWTDSQTARVLPLYAKSPTGTTLWEGEVRAFNSADGSLTFVDSERFEPGDLVVFLPFGYLNRIPDWESIPENLRHLQPGWKRVFDREDDTLLVYRVGSVEPPG